MNFFKNNGAKILCALVYLLLGYIIYALIYKFLPQEINNIVNIISILSAYTSVYALGIMLYQMISVERTTNETKNRINNVLIISDYAKLIEIARFIQEDIKNGKYEVALYKMQHLKDAILINKHRCNDGLTYFSNHISILGVHISSIQTCIINNKDNRINKSSMINDLENLIEFLADKSGEYINK